MHTYEIADTDIAIIGMSGRFPGSNTVTEFWHHLCTGEEGITAFTEQQMRASLLKSLGYVPEERLAQWLSDPKYVRAGAALANIDLFDADFFGYTTAEAELLDPQQRLFLECCWEAFEHAGYNPENHQGLVGVYAGSEMSSYHHNLHSCLAPEERDLIMLLGNSCDYLTSRVSYKLNLKGPSYGVQSACSTSLMAIHVACQALKGGECDLALAGGVVVYPTQEVGYFYQEGLMVSPDGHCAPFDAHAQGTVLAHGGVGVLVLKRLADALADGDSIYAVIKGSATNNDGTLKNGYASPSISGQVKAISEALLVAGVDPATIGYVEAHGTATLLGDSIEVAALTQAFQRKTQQKQFCALGSVKSNVGHMGAAGGVAAVIKTALALQHKLIPATLHYQHPNPQIDFANSPFYVNPQPLAWTGAEPKRAAVNSIAIGGSNVHVILEEAPSLPPATPAQEQPHLLLLSARTPAALEVATANLAAHLKAFPTQPLADVAYTLQVGRKTFAHRRMLVCQNTQEAIEALEAGPSPHLFSHLHEGGHQPLALLLPAEADATTIVLYHQLYNKNAIFQRYVEQCTQLLLSQHALDLQQQFGTTPFKRQDAHNLLSQSIQANALLFICSYAQAKMWQRLGVQATIVIGQGVGEIVAGCLAGIFSLEQALALVYEYGSLQEGQRSIEQVAAVLQQIRYQAPTIQYISALTGSPVTATESMKPLHWLHILQNGAQHKREAIAFEGASDLLLLEIKSGRILDSVDNKRGIPLATRQPATREPDTEYPHAESFSSAIHPEGPGSVYSDRVILTTLGQLWLKGLPINWGKLYPQTLRRRVPLPTYPFERRRYWLYPEQHQDTRKEQAPISASSLENAPQALSQSKRPLDQWFYLPSWKRSLAPEPNRPTALENWLIFCDSPGLGALMAHRLEQLGQNVVTVSMGEHFAQHEEQLFTLNPHHAEDYQTLLETLNSQENYPDRIIHCWGITPSQPPTSTILGIEQLEQAQTVGFYSLISLAQALGTQSNASPLALWAVTNNMQEVAGEELLCPAKATILGPCRVISEEYPHIRCRSIDVVISPAQWRMQRIVEQLLSERSIDPLETIVAYRGDYRYVQTFEQVTVAQSAHPAPRLRPQGTYLITGGLGGIALTLADLLAQRAQARLALVDNAPFPKREQWQEWLASHHKHEKISQKILQIQAMELAGAEVLVIEADVSNAEHLQDAIRRCREHFGMPLGVIHAIGRASGGIIQLKSRLEAEQSLAPVLKSTRLLGEIFCTTKLDFFVLCSSIRSVIGGFGQVDDCALNTFLDAFAAYYRSQTGTFTLALNWDAWKEVGMAAEMVVHPSFQRAHDERLAQGILQAEGCEVFIRALNSNASQLIISTMPLQESSSPGQHTTAITGAPPPEQPEKTQRPNLSVPYTPPSNEIEQALVAIWQGIFGIDNIGVNDHFYELGGHSLLAIKLATRVNHAFPVEISLARIIEAHTIAALAHVVEELLIEKIATLSDAEVEALLQQSIAAH